MLLAVLIQEQGDGELFSAFRRVSPGYFGLALVVLLVSRLFAILRWHILLRSAGVKISFLRSVELTFTGNFSSNFLPTTIGGDVVRLTGAMQLGYDRAICLASLVVDRLVGMAGMALALPFGLVPLFALSSGAAQSAAFSALLQKGMDFVRRTFESLSIWLKKPSALFGSLLATLGNQAFIYLMVYFLLLGIGHRLSFWLVAVMNVCQKIFGEVGFIAEADLCSSKIGRSEIRDSDIRFIFRQLPCCSLPQGWMAGSMHLAGW